MSGKVPLWQEILAFLLSTPTTHYIHDTAFDSNDDSTSDTISNRSYSGFWGSVDAGIDWCEPNYTVTRYIAEFANTLSSIPMICWAIFGGYLCWKYGVRELRHILLLTSLAFIGIGSVAFHGTLRYSAQLLDEIPMILASYCTLYCTLEFENVKPRKSTLYALIGFVLLQCICYIIFKHYLIFVIGFAAVMILQAPLLFIKLMKMKNEIPSHAKYIVIFVATLGAVSWALWTLENMHCAMLGKFHFHAIWHLCGGYALYLLDLLLIYIRGISLKKKSSFEFSRQMKQHYVVWIDE